MAQPQKAKELVQSNQAPKESGDGGILAFGRTEFSGPIPPPEILNQYPRDVRKYITDSAISEQKHRHELEQQLIKTDSCAVLVGAWTTSIVCVLAVVGGVFLIAIGKDGIGVITILAPVIVKGLQLLAGLGKTKNGEVEARDDKKGRQK